MSKFNFEMYRLRAIEEAIAKRYKEQKMRCPVHLSIGQEAGAVGVCAALSHKDKCVSTHRGHIHYLAKGGSLKGLIGELYGKISGCSGGNGGSMHLVDHSVGFECSTSIVGGTIPVGVGLAFANKLKKDPSTVVVFIGDAAVEEGVFHESANFASLHDLNVVFVCENNLYSCYTHISERQPNRPLNNVAHAHALFFLKTEPNDVEDIHRKMKICMNHGPSFLEIPTYRYVQHCGPDNDDNLGYRHPDEIKAWGKMDPLHGVDISSADIARVIQEIEEAFDDAEGAPFPDLNEVGKYDYAPFVI